MIRACSARTQSPGPLSTSPRIVDGRKCGQAPHSVPGNERTGSHDRCSTAHYTGYYGPCPAIASRDGPIRSESDKGSSGPLRLCSPDRPPGRLRTQWPKPLSVSGRRAVLRGTLKRTLKRRQFCRSGCGGVAAVLPLVAAHSRAVFRGTPGDTQPRRRSAGTRRQGVVLSLGGRGWSAWLGSRRHAHSSRRHRARTSRRHKVHKNVLRRRAHSYRAHKNRRHKKHKSRIHRISAVGYIGAVACEPFPCRSHAG
jgi:hypothetical protein